MSGPADAAAGDALAPLPGRSPAAVLFDRFAEEAYDFAHSVSQRPAAAAAAVVEAVTAAGANLDPTRVTSSEARLGVLALTWEDVRRRPRGRVPPHRPDPDGRLDDDDLRRLALDAEGLLGRRDRAVVDLVLRRGLTDDEVAAVLGTRARTARRLRRRALARARRVVRNHLALTVGRRRCPTLGRILSGWDGRPGRRRVVDTAPHRWACGMCRRVRAGLPDPSTLIATRPPARLPGHLRDHL